MARLTLDPKLWQRVRIAAVEEGTTASELVGKVMGEWLQRRVPVKAAVPENGVGAPRSAPPPNLRIEGVIEESHQEGGTRVIDKVRLTGAAITEDPWKDLSERTAGPKLIETPQEAALRMSQLTAARPFTPVPKPTPKTRTARSRSRSSTKTSDQGGEPA